MSFGITRADLTDTELIEFGSTFDSVERYTHIRIYMYDISESSYCFSLDLSRGFLFSFFEKIDFVSVGGNYFQIVSDCSW